MSDEFGELNHVKKATAVLATCIVQTMNESDTTFQERFIERLERAYDKLKNTMPDDDLNELELLSWTRELITGFSIVSGQGRPFLQD